MSDIREISKKMPIAGLPLDPKSVDTDNNNTVKKFTPYDSLSLGFFDSLNKTNGTGGWDGKGITHKLRDASIPAGFLTLLSTNIFKNKAQTI